MQVHWANLHSATMPCNYKAVHAKQQMHAYLIVAFICIRLHIPLLPII